MPHSKERAVSASRTPAASRRSPASRHESPATAASPTAVPSPPQAISLSEARRGRPITHTEPWAKITVVLLDRQVAFLDRAAIDIRLKHGKAISRAEIIRAFIDAAQNSGVDLSLASTVEEIVALLNHKK